MVTLVVQVLMLSSSTCVIANRRDNAVVAGVVILYSL